MKTTLWTAALLAAAMCLAPTSVSAQPRGGRAQRLQQRFAARFDAIDRNHDGVISRDEWNRNPRLFNRLDRNRDGVLSRAELRRGAVRAARRRR